MGLECSTCQGMGSEKSQEEEQCGQERMVEEKAAGLVEGWWSNVGMMEDKQRAAVWMKAGTRSRVKGKIRDVVMVLWRRKTLIINMSKA